MADKKISQLTGASTPLAGTEVLPIVQSGSTVKVSVDNLTTGKNVTVGSVNKVTITAPATSATLTVANGKTLTANNTLTLAGTDSTTMTFPSTSATIARTDAGQTFTGNQTFPGGVNVTGGKVQSVYAAGGDFVALFQNTTSATPYGVWIKDAAAPAAGYPLLNITSGDGATVYMRVDSDNGNAYVGKGNIAFSTAAKGIDFSANTGAAGETSSLLNWYETGTWTPVLSCATPGTLAVTYSVQKGYYTRVGRVVHIWGNIQTSAVTVGTATGAVRLTGLPFTSATAATAVETYMGSMGYQGINKAGYTDFNPQLQENTTYVLILASKSDGNAAANVAIGDLSAGTNLLYWQVTYVAA